MIKKIPAIPGLCDDHDDELLTIDEMVSQYEENALTHFRAMNDIAVLNSEWYWRRVLAIRAIVRAHGLLRSDP